MKSLPSLYYVCTDKQLSYKKIKREPWIEYKLEGLTPLHHLCLNKRITKKILNYVLNKHKLHKQFVYEDFFHAPLTLLCENESITNELIRSIAHLKWHPNSLLSFSGNRRINLNMLKSLLHQEWDTPGFLKMTPLSRLCRNKKFNIDMLKLFIDKDWEHIDYTGNTPMHNLCSNENLTIDMIKVMKDKEWFILNKFKRTPLDVLARRKDFTVEMFECLLYKYKNLNTPLHRIINFLD